MVSALADVFYLIKLYPDKIQNTTLDKIIHIYYIFGGLRSVVMTGEKIKPFLC